MVKSLYLQAIIVCLLLATVLSHQPFVESDNLLEIDEQKLQEVNFLINTYFEGCSLDQQSKIFYQCSIPIQKYAQFLYAVFHKQLIMNFLKYYQQHNKLDQDQQVGQMYKIGENIHGLVVGAYGQWIKVYKPDERVQVEEMYADLVDLDANVLDIIEHLPKYKQFQNVLREVYKLGNLSKKYVVMGEKNEQEIAQDFMNIYSLYFGKCRPITQCTLSLSAFAYLTKQIAFYITPLSENAPVENNEILISEESDFKATQFLLEEINKLEPVLGEQLSYEDVKYYSQQLIQPLFQSLTRENFKEHQGTRNISTSSENGFNNQSQPSIQL